MKLSVDRARAWFLFLGVACQSLTASLIGAGFKTVFVFLLGAVGAGLAALYAHLNNPGSGDSGKDGTHG